MGFLIDMWMPILASAAAVWVLSAIMHMLLQFHKNDYVGLPGESEIVETLRSQNLAVGDYMFPHAEKMSDLAKPEMIEKFTRGPVGIITILPSGPPSIGKQLVQQFLYNCLISIFVAYFVSFVDPKTAIVAFRLTGTVAVLGYAVTAIPNSIWRGLAWKTTAKFMLDGVLYGLVTGAVFAGMGNWGG